MKNIWKAEPTAILALIQAGITLLVCFGLHLTIEQVGAILTFSGALLAVVNRSQVHSPSTVEALKEALTNPPSKFPDVH
jgi:hypothetical protein